MRILVIGKIWPEPSSSAAGMRTMDLLRAFSLAEWEVHFASAAQSSEFTVSEDDFGNVTSHSIQLNHSSFDEWLEKLAPNIVVFDRFMTEEQFGWRVSKMLPDALRVIDTSDLHFLREARKKQLDTRTELDLYNETAIREIAALLRSDLSLVISEFEQELLNTHFPYLENGIAYWPFCLEEPIINPPAFHQRRDFAMIGSFLHEPNWDAVRWCKKEIWPAIRQSLPDASLHIYGSYTSSKVEQLDDPKSGFLIKGRADEAIPTLAKYRLSLAPLRFGAGLKGKLADAFLAGTPTVASPVACEGMCGTLPWGSPVASDPSAFSDTAIQLYTDEAKWKYAQECGYTIAKKRFAAADWLTKLPNIIEDAFANRASKRKRNFIGRMLNFHHHRSTEFMSRWIEAKNAARQ